MAKANFLTACLVVPLLIALHGSLHAHSAAVRDGFVMDVNRPFVYVKFDHIGPGAPRKEIRSKSGANTAGLHVGSGFLCDNQPGERDPFQHTREPSQQALAY